MNSYTKVRPRNQIYRSKAMNPNVEQVMDKKVFIIVDQKGKPITHRDGYLLPFHRRRDATYWLQENNGLALHWKIERVKICLEK